ncbi:magnesium chelatase domain-containing protein [Streptomyces shenzhenensis]
MARIARPTHIGVISDGVLTQDGNPYNLKYAVIDAQPDGVLEDVTTPNYVVGDALYRTGVVVDADHRGLGVAWPAAVTPKAADHSALALRETAEGGTAATFTATANGVLAVTATRSPATSHTFSIDGLPAYAAETRDRVRAAITNTGHAWPTGQIAVHVGPNCTAPSPSFDLAAACAVLAAGGSADPAALIGVVLIGELGLDGRVRPVRDFRSLMRAAIEAGELKFVVPDEQAAEAAASFPDFAVTGVRDLNEALAFLTEMTA